MRRWSFLLRQRQAWGVIMGRVLEEPVAWLFYSWLPLYLTKFMGVSLMKTGFLLTIPFLTQDIGFIAGGFAASRLLKNGWTVDRTRKCVIFVSAICMMSSVSAIRAPTPLTFVLLISVATFGHGSWSSNIMSMPGDIVPPSAVGTLYGMTGCGGALGSILFTQIIGVLVDTEGSFSTVFTIGGILPLVAAIVMFTVGGKVQPLLSAVHARKESFSESS
jgi:ACS family hexuronate transporter-like MFS transporter